MNSLQKIHGIAIAIIHPMSRSTTYFTKSFFFCVILVSVSVSACTKGPATIIGDSDPFSKSFLIPKYADSNHLYFFAHKPDYILSDEAAVDGLYRLPLAGGEPTLLLKTSKARTMRRGETDLLITSLDDSTAKLTRIPLDGSEVTSQTLPDQHTRIALEANGSTYVLANDLETSISRRSKDGELEKTFRMSARSYLRYNSFYASNGFLYWLEDVPLRISDDLKGQTPEQLTRPAPEDIPLSGTVESTHHYLLGVINNEVYGVAYHTSFFETGGSWSNGDPKGYSGFGGGAIYTITLNTAPRVIEVGIKKAIIVGTRILAQKENGDLIFIDPSSGKITSIDATPSVGLFLKTIVASEERLFYQAFSSESESSIEYITLIN